MVHEFRTPLAALTAASHLLQRPDLPDDQRDKLSVTVQNEVQRLNEMSTDFLELARLESGRIRFVREPVHLGGLVGECLEIVRPQAEADHITIEPDIDSSLPPVQGDRNRLKQVVLNLLSNAIKYNHREGKIVVRLSREGEEFMLAVRDTGRGIPPESLPHLFERFYRVPDQEGHVGGTGLGLAIVKRILESQQGQVSVESEVGKGTTFTVRLPASVGSAMETRPVS